MHLSRVLTALSCFAVITALAHPAEAKKKRKLVEEYVVSIPHILLPDAIADRIEGSGVECRSFAEHGGARHKMEVASLRLNLTERVSVRGGIGMAHIVPLPLAYEQTGLVASARVSVSLWRVDGYSADIDVAGLQARYDGGKLTDGSVMFMFRRRP